MKKTGKSLVSLLVACAMVFSFGMAAFATEITNPVEPTYNITINNANQGHTYGAYQLFAGDISDGVLSTITWGASIQKEGVDHSTALLDALKADIMLKTYFGDCTTAQDVATVLQGKDTDEVKAFSNDNANLQQFAKVVGDVLTIKNQVNQVAAPTGNAYTIADVDPGYYLVKDENPVTGGTDASTRYILDVTNNVAVTPKQDIPTVEKKVLEDSDITNKLPLDNSNYNDVADWNIGQTQSFTIYANLPTEMWNYNEYSIIFHDSYDKGFDITDPAGDPLAADAFTSAHYNVYCYAGNPKAKTVLNQDTFTGELKLADKTAINTAQPPNATDGALTFTCDDIKAALEAKNIHSGEVTVVIEYYAELNQDAIVGKGGNFNEVYLEYTNDPYTVTEHGTTQKDEAIVFTFDLNGNKYDAANQSKKLEGAQFILGQKVTDTSGSKTMKWATTSGADSNVLTGWDSNETADSVYVLTSDENGNFSIKGLDSGTYFLKEIKAPAGYNMLAEPVEITVTSVKGQTAIYTQDWNTSAASDAISDYTVQVAGNNAGATVTDSKSIDVPNQKGSTLPETGDTGRAIFYTIGAMGFSCTAIILITKKRMENYKK